ncbi:MAG: agmatine deiminase family protein [Verrucomicrobiales bacterium]|jgi:agmatine deiminase|nr:agmatine deiminase family protein [Verrucomicrobiales bacterium]
MNPDTSLLTPENFDFSAYAMPAEWAPHEATWLVWPVNVETWPEDLERVRNVYAQMIEALTANEKVILLTGTCEVADDVQQRLAKSGTNFANLKLVNIPVNDSWVRDSGPIFLKAKDADNQVPLVANDFIFNTWGQKYGPWDDDDQIPTRGGQMFGFPVIKHDLVLEGGSIDVNGAGCVLTTKQCLLNPNRNPSLTQQQIEDKLKRFLGVQQVLWLDDGIEGDDTDGHIDDITRFVSENKILTVVEPNKADANHEPLNNNFKQLQTFRDANGKPFEIIELPMPDRLVEGPFGRSPASYGNFYIANGTVLVPIYSAPNDQIALDIIQSCFPDRKVIGIECSPLVNGLGSIHCVTQQQPK